MRCNDELSNDVTTPPSAMPVGPFASVASEDGSAPSLSGDDPATQRAYGSLPPVTGYVPLSVSPPSVSVRCALLGSRVRLTGGHLRA